jgi:C-methyltransferase-like protein/putative zinc binding protein/methyltransferase family protein
MGEGEPVRSRVVAACRVCGGRKLDRFLSLGEIPPVNALLRSEAEGARERRFPLDVDRCEECAHVQLGLLLFPEDVFREYLYFSGYAESVLAHGRALAARYAGLLDSSALVAELASNDGAVLAAFKERARILGIDPARNVAAVAVERGIPTWAEFFGRALVPRLIEEVGRPRLVLARNVLAHVPDLQDFAGGVADWLAEGGVFHIEVPYLVPMLRTLAFDTIYHEHLSYFSVSVVARLLEQVGLELFDVEELALHGGSLLLSAGHPGAHRATGAVERYRERERAEGLHTPAPYRAFAERVGVLRRALPAFIADLKRGGARVAAYGAAAKGVVLLNTTGLGRDQLEYVADRSPHKQGCLLPGVHLPVVAPERVLADRPDYLLVLAWNFFDEIARQLDGYRRAGGRFVLPLPAPHVVEG